MRAIVLGLILAAVSAGTVGLMLIIAATATP